MTGRLLDSDPELAYEHAQAAVRRAGRVDVVREAAGLAAYRTGRFAEALRELRTVRRLNGSSEHLAIMADCERGLGRPERAIALAASDEVEALEPQDQVELAMVVSGARLDLGEPEAALATLSTGEAARVTRKDGLLAVRVAHAKAAALEALGRTDDAAEALAGFSAAELAEAAGEVDEPVVVWDLADDEEADAPVEADADAGPASGSGDHADGQDVADGRHSDAADGSVDDVDAPADVEDEDDVPHVDDAGSPCEADARTATAVDTGTDTDTDTDTDSPAADDAGADADTGATGDAPAAVIAEPGTGTGAASGVVADPGPDAATAAEADVDTEERA
jgi:hypothetical protein